MSEKARAAEALPPLFFQGKQRIESLSAKRDLSDRREFTESTRMQTALYLRVSTAQQRPDLQEDGLRGYATRAGLEIVATYMDHAVSGRQETRPQLQALMRARGGMPLPVSWCGSLTGLPAV